MATKSNDDSSDHSDDDFHDALEPDGQQTDSLDEQLNKIQIEDDEKKKEDDVPEVLTDDEYKEEEEKHVTADALNIRFKEATLLKENGNEKFKSQDYVGAIELYSSAIKLCPLLFKEDRSIFYNNRAVARQKLGSDKDHQKALSDLTKSIQLNPEYLKPLIRRAQIFKEIGNEKLDDALNDYKKIIELDPNNNDAKMEYYHLDAQIKERNEKLKTEMMGKLKDLGNLVLRPFGLSTENFQLQQNEGGGYSLNMKQ